LTDTCACLQVGGYQEGFEPDNGKNGSCTMPRAEIRQLRLKYADRLGQRKDLVQQKAVALPPAPTLSPEEDDLGDLPRLLGKRTIYFLHVHKAGGTPFCRAAKSHSLTLADPNWNCNGRGDDPSYNKGEAGLYNNEWTCQQRAAAMSKQQVAFFAVETVFHPVDLECEDDFYFAMVLRHPIERLMDHVAFESQFWTEGWEVAKTWMGTNTHDTNTRRGSAVVDNYLTRVLLGEPTYSKPLGTLTRADLTKAKAVLREMLVFSYTDLKTRAAAMTKCYFKWPVLSENNYLRDEDHSAGVRAHLQRFGDAGVAKLVQLNQLDMELYAFGLARADMLYRACVDS